MFIKPAFLKKIYPQSRFRHLGNKKGGNDAGHLPAALSRLRAKVILAMGGKTPGK